MIQRLPAALLAAPLLIALTTPAFAAGEPDWLKNARAREAKSLEARPIESKDKWFKAKVPGKSVGAIVKEEGSYSVELDIGADVSIYCEVYPDGIDLAQTLSKTADVTFEQVAENRGAIEMRELESMDTGAFGAVPYLQTQWLYLVGKEQKQIGGLKQFALRKKDHGVYCSHLDLGYTKTFLAVAQAFAASLEASSDALTPYYTEVLAISIGGRRVGISSVTLARDPDGDIQAREQSALLVPLEKGAVSAEDSYQTEWSDARGKMINALQVSISDGEVEMDTALKRADGKWVVEGEQQGKKISYTLAEGVEPGTMLGQVLELRAILASEKPVGTQHSIPMWTDVDVSKLLDFKTKITAKRDAQTWSAVGEMASVKLDMELDSTGSARSLEMRFGPQVMKMERIHVSGKF